MEVPFQRVLLDAALSVVRSTVRQLPLSCIVPLLKEIVRRVQTKTKCVSSFFIFRMSEKFFFFEFVKFFSNVLPDGFLSLCVSLGTS